jgi:hypothetical protein
VTEENSDILSVPGPVNIERLCANSTRTEVNEWVTGKDEFCGVEGSASFIS